MDLATVKALLSENWLGTSIGLVGLVFGVYTYATSRRASRVSWRYSAVRLVGAHAQLGTKLAVSYDGASVPRLTLSKVFIWNSGTETIRRADIADHDRVRIQLGDDAHLLNATVEKSVRPVNAVTVESSAAGAFIDFDFLDPGDGVRISLLHTGDKIKPQLAGTLKGMPTGFSGGNPFPDLPDTRFPRGRKLVGVLALTAAFGVLLLAQATVTESVPKMAAAMRWISGSLGSLFILSAVAFPFVTRAPFPESLAESGSLEDGKTS